MSAPGRPGRTTVLVGLALALLLAVAYAVVASTPRRPDPQPALPSPTTPATATPATPTPEPIPTAPPPGAPQRGAAYPVRSLGSLTGRSVIASGHGNADLRYARAAHSATRVHLTCRGCTGDTWLVQQPYGFPVGASGPLPHPEDATTVADVADPRARTDLLLEAAPGADWSVTLTPFSELPVHEATFDALGDDVIAVRARTPVSVTCGSRIAYRTFAREPGAADFRAVQPGAERNAGTIVLDPRRGTDVLVLVVSCAGRWTVTLS